MSGARIRLEIDDSELRDVLARVQSADIRGLYARIGETVKFQTDQRFAQEKGPDGSPWQPLKKSTIADSFTRRGQGRRASGPRFERFSGRRRILQDTYRLRGSIQFQVVEDGVLVGTNVIYAKVHQFGSRHTIPITAKMRKFFWAKFYETGDPKFKALALTKKSAIQTNIPARPFLGINAENQAEIGLVIRDWIDEQINSR